MTTPDEPSIPDLKAALAASGLSLNGKLERDIRATLADPVGRLGWPVCKTTPGEHCVCRAGNPTGCARERDRQRAAQ